MTSRTMTVFCCESQLTAAIEPLLPHLPAYFHFEQGSAETFLTFLREHESTSVVVLCGPQEMDTLWRLYQAFVQCPFKVLLFVADEANVPTEWQTWDALVDYQVGIPSPSRLVFLLNRAYAHLLAEQQTRQLSRQLEVQSHRLHDLNEIGIALSTERNLDTLLYKILKNSMEITASDSGSLYLVEQKPGVVEDPKQPLASKRLRFKLPLNMSLNVDFSEFPMEINEHSMAGFVAVSAKPLNIADAYEIPDSSPFHFNKSFDQKTGYRSKSMLTVPMKNQKNEIIGILQLINKKRRWEQPLNLSDETALIAQIASYDTEDENLVSSLASQAAVAIENTRLYQSIQSLFEGFIRASVQAIESRDPTTSGHSERVAQLTVGLAEATDRVDEGCYQHTRFTREELKEMKYASLLHDFGKIGVREHVLVKAEKLYPHELATITHRFKLIRKTLEHDYSLKKLNYLLESTREEALAQFASMEQEMQNQLLELDEQFKFVLQANQPTVLAQGGFERLQQFGQMLFQVDQETVPLLDSYEIGRLSIERGSLDNDERLEIESHVTHTFRFLSQIPWTSELKNVPEIAYAHHEKINGTGYPRQLDVSAIPVQSKMMTIADIYDALTASDRPYKKALPVSRALDILGYEVKDGKLDSELYRIFVETKVYEKIH